MVKLSMLDLAEPTLRGKETAMVKSANLYRDALTPTFSYVHTSHIYTYFRTYLEAVQQRAGPR